MYILNILCVKYIYSDFTVDSHTCIHIYIHKPSSRASSATAARTVRSLYMYATCVVYICTLYMLYV